VVGRKPIDHELVDWERFPSWNRAVRSFARARRAIDKWLKKPVDWHASLKSEELREARILLLKAAQKTIGTQPPNKRLVYAMDTDGLIRLQSRIGYADTSADLKNPLVLPQGSPVARLLMQQSHSCQKHTGVDSTLVGFLGNHWTPEARRLAKKVVGSCPTCRRVRGPTFQLPPMPQLPVDRVRPTRAFEAVGIDYL
jgi:hypothetical protein